MLKSPPSARLLSLLFLGWLLAFWAAFLSTENVPPVLGNKPLLPYPMNVSRGLDQWMRDWTAWLIDHSLFRYRVLVKRNDLVEAVAVASYPVPVHPGLGDLTVGKDGWIFLMDEAAGETPKKFITEMGTHAVKIAKTVKSSGREFCLIPIPDKSTLYPEYTGWVQRLCDRGSRRAEFPSALQSAFSAAGPGLESCYCPLWAVFAKHKQANQELLFWPTDSHWNSRGMTVGLRHVIEHLAPALWSDSVVTSGGLQAFRSDLRSTYMLQQDFPSEQVDIIRRGDWEPRRVENVTVPGYAMDPIVRFTNDNPNVIKGRTVIIADSFVLGAMSHWSPWFEDVTFIHYNYTGSAELYRRMKESDRILFIVVERFLRWRIKMWATRHFEEISAALTPKTGAP